MRIARGKVRSYKAHRTEKIAKGEIDLIDLTERWANIMEIKIDKGLNIADIALENFNEVNIKALSSTSISSAVRILVEFWLHGKSFGIWWYGHK